VHVVKCGFQIFKSSFVLTPELLDVPIELRLRSADLLLKQIGTVLQVATDVTHLMIPQPSTARFQATIGELVPANPSEPSIMKRRDFSATQLGESKATTRLHSFVGASGEGLRRLLGFARRIDLESAFIAALRLTRKITRGPKPVRALREIGLAADVPVRASDDRSGNR
jgi:hypothetical protein